MNKNELITAARGIDYREVYHNLNEASQKESGQNFLTLLLWAGATLRALFKASQNAKRGNFAAATYYAVLWHGLNTAQGRALDAHKNKKVDPFDNLLGR